MLERRKSPRSLVFKTAKIVVGTSSVLDCVVRNLTNDGARIEMPYAASVPEAIDITFDGGRTFRPGRLAWRTVNAMGVRFFEPAQRHQT